MNKRASYSDEDLIDLARSGNNNAYNSLLERYHTRIQKIVYFHTNDPAHVKDVTQEVLLKVYRNLSCFKEECQFSTWLYRITQNTVKNYFRTINLHLISENMPNDEQFSSYYYSPEHQLINSEFGEQIERAISKLSEELQTCYEMYLFEGHTYEEISQKLACPIGTVRSRIYRARKLLSEFVTRTN